MKSDFLFYPSILVIAICSTSCSDKDPLADQYPNIKQLSYIIQVQNPRNWTVPKSSITVYLPASETSYHHLLDYSVTGTDKDEHRLLKDGIGNNLLNLKLQDVVSGYTGTVKLTAKIGIAENVLESTTPNIDGFLIPDASSENIPVPLSGDDDLKIKMEKIFVALAAKLESVLEPENGTDEKSEPESASESPSDSDVVLDPFYVPKPELDDARKMELPAISQARRITNTARFNKIPARAVLGVKLTEAQQDDEKSLLLWVEVFENNLWHKIDLETQKPADRPEQYLGLRLFEALSDLRGDDLSALLGDGQGLAVDISLK